MITQKLIPLLLVVLLVSLRHVLTHSPKVDGANRIRCIERERQALLKIKDELVNPDDQLSSWGNEENKMDCCKWRGVHCHSKTNHVTRLELWYEFNFPPKGNISTSLLELHHLQYLDLSFNDFNYIPIPEFISSLRELRYLNLRNCNFAGPIPRHLGNLSKLSHLDLGSNVDCHSDNLDWISHLHSLEYLALDYTNLSMATNWFQAISKLTCIKELHLGHSGLPEIPLSSIPSINGSTPLTLLDLSGNSDILSPLTLIHWFSNFSSTGLTFIDFSFVSMPGPFPDVFENMISLEHLHLSGAGLDGGIPQYLGNMSNLVDLNLSSNSLTGDLSELLMNLSGPIQENLQDFDLSYNSISGSFPNMSRFSSLNELKLRRNQLNGFIPEGHLQLPHLIVLDLSSNRLTGPIPDLTFSSSLEQLVLENNMFNGTLPQSIGRLSNLEALYIGSNLLEGIITEDMLNLSQLQILDLSFSSNVVVKFSPQWVPPFQLHYLNLRHYKLGPFFPLWLKTQKELYYIDISNTGISDSIPSWFGGMAPTLYYLNASNNQMYGPSPDFYFSNISSYFVHYAMILDLSRNKISGPVTFLCHIRDWELLDLSDNLLSGQIPDCFTHFKSLEYLNLANNRFSGKIPYSFGSLSALSILYLRNNSFSGELPTSMANCTNLIMIDVGQNRLTGKIPDWMGDSFSKLKFLILRFNEFYGNIPSNLCGLANLQILDLSSNNIAGVVPNCVHKYIAMTKKEYDDDDEWFSFKIWKGFSTGVQLNFAVLSSLEQAYFMWKGKEVKYRNTLPLVKLIDLSSNNLGGTIPSEITKLVGLVQLNFSRNNLTGPIPHNIGDMKLLDSLDFSRNHLSGSIPSSLGELNFLGTLNLSCNNLSGRIPQGTQLQSFNESTYMCNSGLCGLPLNKSCPGDHDSNSRDNAIRKGAKSKDGEFIIIEEFYIALGLGFIVGFWGIFGTILFNKATRYAFLKLYNIIEDFVYIRMELTKARLRRYFQNGWSCR